MAHSHRLPASFVWRHHEDCYVCEKCAATASSLLHVSELIVYELPELHDPVLAIALGGVTDASGVTIGMFKFLQDTFETKEIAAIDPESFYNFARYRPLTNFDADGQLQIRWPEITFLITKTSNERDLILATGVEPNYKWNRAAHAFTTIAETIGCQTIVALSSFAGAIPHSRPFPVTELTAENAFAERYGMGLLPIEQPSGFLKYLTEALRPSVNELFSFEVEVPHYLPEPPNPKATQALLQAIEDQLELDLSSGLLNTNIAAWEQNVANAIDQDMESISYVKELEEQFDDETVTANAQHDFVLDVENYLRTYTDETGDSNDR